MPRKPAQLKKQQRRIPENIWMFLNDEIRSCDDFELLLLSQEDSEIKKLWDVSREEILSDWIRAKPGTRPLLWWRLDSPGNRERIGGNGRLLSEKYSAILQYWEKGIFTGWDWIDETDPPTFESEAAYLDRHGLLTAAEKKFIEKHPELMKPEKVIFGEDENGLGCPKSRKNKKGGKVNEGTRENGTGENGGPSKNN